MKPKLNHLSQIEIDQRIEMKTLLLKVDHCKMCLKKKIDWKKSSEQVVRLLARAGESCAIPTLDFSRHGHAVYMCSASELQKVTVNAELAAALSDVLGQLFLGMEMPERPRAGLADTLGKLFSSSASAFDADEVFGDSSGKASKSVARYVSPPAGSKMEQAKAKSANTTNVVAEAHRKLLERGEKLGQVEDATAKMADQAKSFGSGANQLKQHYQNKKWWQF